MPLPETGAGPQAEAGAAPATWDAGSSDDARPEGERAEADRDLVGTYLDEIARVPLLDAAREVELAKEIEAGLYAQRLLENPGTAGKPRWPSTQELEQMVAAGQRAKEAFLTANLRLVVSIARRYTRSGMPLLDLVQEGNLGLVRAVEKFDYSRGFKFSTYATWWVRQAITRAIAEQSRTIRLPVHLFEKLNSLGRARRELTRALGREPTEEELAAHLDMPVDRVLELTSVGRDPVSLDALVGDDEETRLGDLVEDVDAVGPEAAVVERLGRERIDSLLSRLDPRSADVLRARYGLGDGREQTLTEIGLRIGLSRERVRQLERQALHDLRRIAVAEGLDAA
jgi:RNA polymerase sigma factor (sigma-70 family)